MLVRGIVLGGLSASGLSLLMVGAVAIVAPPPAPSDAGRAQLPAAPRAASPGSAPETLPEAPAPDLAAQGSVPASQPSGIESPQDGAPVTGVELPAGSQFGRGSGQDLATPGLPEAGPSRAAIGTPPVAPAQAPQGFAPATDIAQQPDIAVAVAPATGPTALDADPAAPAPVIEGAPTTFRPTGIGEGSAGAEVTASEGEEAEEAEDVAAVVEVPGGTLTPTEIGDDQAPPLQRPDRVEAREDVAELAPLVVEVAPLAPVEQDEDSGPTRPASEDLAALSTAPDAPQSGETPIPGEIATAGLAPPDLSEAGPGGLTPERGQEGVAVPGPGLSAPEARAPQIANAPTLGEGQPGDTPPLAERDATVSEAPRAASDGADLPGAAATQPEGTQTADAAPDAARDETQDQTGPSLTAVAPLAPVAPSDTSSPDLPLAELDPGAPARARSSALESDMVVPGSGEIAGRSPAAPVTGEVEAPTAPQNAEIALAEAAIGPQTPALELDRSAPSQPGAEAPARDGAVSTRTAAPGATSEAEPDLPVAGSGTASPIQPVPESDRVDPPRREAEGPAPAPIVPRVITPGQPRRIQLGNTVLPQVSAPEEPGTALPQAAGSGSARAISRNAADFDVQAGQPLFGIVLVDDGQGVSPENLAAIDFPVTFALDALDPGAPERAEAYRAAGQEVVLLANALPEDATPQDLEVALAGALQALPQAMGVLDTPDRRLTRNRQSLPALAATGHGLLAHPGGLGTAVSEARRAGIPAAQLYRLLDEDNERATVITRYLDRATFEAVQSGSTIVVGRARPETITAIYSWRLGERAENVQVAPLSAVLQAAED